MRPKKVILLVDDNEQALSVRRFLLETHRYRVLTASSAREALEIAEAALPGSIHLLLTDFVMPRMDGSELARRFRQLRPEAGTMIVSGLVATNDTHHADCFLAKGVATPAVMLDQVRTLCARRRGPKKPPQSLNADCTVRKELAS